MENNLVHVAHDWRNRIGIKKEYTRVKILTILFENQNSERYVSNSWPNTSE